MNTSLTLRILSVLEYILKAIEFILLFAKPSLCITVAFYSLSALVQVAKILEDAPKRYNISTNRLIIYSALSLIIIVSACTCFVFCASSPIIILLAALCFIIDKKLGEA